MNPILRVVVIILAAIVFGKTLTDDKSSKKDKLIKRIICIGMIIINII